MVNLRQRELRSGVEAVTSLSIRQPSVNLRLPPDLRRAKCDQFVIKLIRVLLVGYAVAGYQAAKNCHKWYSTRGMRPCHVIDSVFCRLN